MNEIEKNSLKAWWLAARPKTLTGAAVPVMIGVATAFADGTFQMIPAMLCFLFAFLMQIDANFVNDYYDFKKGLDDEHRLGPKRACAEGWISLPAMRNGIIVTTLLSCMAGLPLVLYGGYWLVMIGVACVLFTFLYTTTLARVGAGDLLVLLFFGIVPVCMTYYLQTHCITWQVFLLSLASGLVVDGLLVVNNYRDVENDKRGGKVTLVVLLGKKTAENLYLWLGITTVALCQTMWMSGQILAAVLPFLFLVFHVFTWRKMKKIAVGKELNQVLGDTARNIFIFGLLVTIGLIIKV
ncbi:MAG: 1,4-dihydroxy-2-naphthoate octaprenyltransferase [Paraprevotella sp.]|nr:1,4-dihydroxy-2-naphthoate octaprenyltransferase [Paraprevotella sp.]